MPNNLLDIDSTSDIEIDLLLRAIFLTYQYDFQDYARDSIKRRVNLALTRMDCSSISILQNKILRNPQAFAELLQFLTVPVSEMFRDPTYFKAFRDTVVPYLKTFTSIKIWIAGCSTGEEVYSLAIILKEENLLERTMIYASDINPESLNKAKAGIFKLENVKKFTKSYQLSGGQSSFSDYYVADFDSVILNKSLKKNITFIDHSLATDSVFTETHFISCRNVLIYFKRVLQERSFRLFYESLCDTGHLGLGPKETVEFSTFGQHFNLIANTNTLYQKRHHIS